MFKRRYLFGLVVIGVIVIGLLTIAAIPRQTGSEKHCYSILSPVDAGSNETSKVLESGCFDTFAESIQAATEGNVNLDPFINPNNVTDEMLNPDGISLQADSKSSTVIGIDYKNSNFDGDSYTWAVTGTGCTDTTSFGISSMPSGWDNTVSSARAYGGCNHYYH